MIVVDNNSWYVNSMSLTRKKLLHYISLLFSTIVIIFLFVYQLYSSDIKAMFFKTSNGQFKTETQSEYYKRINKTDKESEKNEIAIKAGKILTDIFINNTEDNTGLIEKVAEKNNLEYNK